ncbi:MULTISPECIES: DUF1822 family protein [Cyanophyceae]|uniref:DUF1822 family protein n=1 Tax=Cyanophyceae TaxID=3028117 RepID=UPI0023300A59|nr:MULTISPECIES: DUF1822 family protein [Cyanophyceae]MDB9357542.1 DUF1822 family protein [Nodularia spumigena CS-587/03]MDB9319809.1 DUF1822 family protein [Nodularia spumigena CS-590/01A]MDB9322060.1 DUF1822 family protein [Nodularia spumigena CS-591/07A]MDB9327662.1 DUF1822 family protein [Nodularia spumigena CS-590/02]MDB9331085.1 DUF1822 family protein [Nodularia spumigena CS-591/04]
MTDKLNLLRELAIPFPIPPSFRRQAKAYASQYFTQEAQKRSYLNTLALLVANGYLRLLGFKTNLNKLERWNALYRLWSEGNELELSGLGNLECCVITPGQETVILPPETCRDEMRPIIGDSVRVSVSPWDSALLQADRIGYLFVEIPISEHTAKLVGFIPDSDITDAEIAIADLQSMDDLIDYLAPAETVQTNDLTREFAQRKITYLRNWLNNIYTADWQPSMRDLRGATCKKKLNLAGQVFDLQLSVSQDQDKLILVRVIVQSENAYLPGGMQVSVPDESEIYTETVNEAADLISIPLELVPGEEFWVELRLGEDSIREYFIA